MSGTTPNCGAIRTTGGSSSRRAERCSWRGARHPVALDGVPEATRRAANGEFGRLAIGFTGSATHATLPALAGALREALPGVMLDCAASCSRPPRSRACSTAASTWVVHDAAEETCAADGFRPRVVLEAAETPTPVSFVATAIGSLVPDSVRHMTVSGAVYRLLAPRAAGVELAVAGRRDDRTPVLERALGIVRSALSRDRAVSR